MYPLRESKRSFLWKDDSVIDEGIYLEIAVAFCAFLLDLTHTFGGEGRGVAAF